MCSGSMTSLAACAASTSGATTKEPTSVVLDPDVVQMFPATEAVNSSLRALAEIIRRRRPVPGK